MSTYVRVRVRTFTVNESQRLEVFQHHESVSPMKGIHAEGLKASDARLELKTGHLLWFL